LTTPQAVAAPLHGTIKETLGQYEIRVAPYLMRTVAMSPICDRFVQPVIPDVSKGASPVDCGLNECLAGQSSSLEVVFNGRFRNHLGFVSTCLQLPRKKHVLHRP
jgi:hypothetical protein